MAPLQFSLKYTPWLDGMRAFAVLAVMLHHARAPFSSGGFIGVDIFFVISGFLITGLMLNEHAKTGTVSFSKFYMRRALRLLPALFLVLALMLLFNPFYDGLRSTLIDLGIVAGYAANWTKALGFNRPICLIHCWSLSIEEQFYILWPALFLVLLRVLKSRGRLLAAVVGLACLSTIERTCLFLLGRDPMRQYYGLDTRADSLLIGCALALALATYGLPRPHGLGGKIIRVGALLAVPCLAYTMKFGLRQHASMQTAGFTVVALLTAAFAAYLIANPNHPAARFLSWGPLVWIGKVSYGLYLFHWPMFRYLHNTELSRWSVMAIVFPASFLLAALSYHYIEAPALRLKDKFRSTREKREEIGDTPLFLPTAK